MDNLSEEDRKRTMRNIRSRDTKPERIVRSFLHRKGFRFRLHRTDLPGSPDIVLPKYKLIIFVHGCFWHQHSGCVRSTTPKSNTEYWIPKLLRNVERDRLNQRRLVEMGWSVVVIWECQTKYYPDLKHLFEHHIVRHIGK